LPLQLTSSGDNEDPDFSPDGRYLVFATTFGRGPGNFGLSLMRNDGSAMKELYRSRGGDSEPTWGPLDQ
jgi:Tol biopolymer transport system component